jgi:hypothetical protein
MMVGSFDLVFSGGPSKISRVEWVEPATLATDP